MIRNRFAAALAVTVFAVLHAASGHAQARPTATQEYQISVFGGVSGVYTGLESGKNISITGGADLGFHNFFSLHPSIEVRGTYPVADGDIDSQRNILAGLKVEKSFHRIHPYADIFYGRGQINYNFPFSDPIGRFYYIQSISNILSPGVGVDIDLNDHFALKLDGQFQRYTIPVTTSGSIYSKPITVGVVYRFDFNHHKHTRY